MILNRFDFKDTFFDYNFIFKESIFAVNHF